jgi:hypothetical protein
VLLAVLAASPLVLSQDRRAVGRDAIFASPIHPRFGVLEIARFVEVERVGPEEFVRGGGRSRSTGSYRPGGFASVELELDMQVIRSVPAVWQMRLESVDALQEINVRVELGTPDGRTNVLTHDSDPGSIVYARVDALPPRVLEVDDGGVLIEGGVMLHLDLQKVRASGAHSGTLTVTVEHF